MSPPLFFFGPGSNRGCASPNHASTRDVISRNKVRPLNFCVFVYVRRTNILELFGSQEGVLRF